MQEAISRVNIGVVGRSNVGKTSFIRCLCEQAKMGAAALEQTAGKPTLPHVHQLKPNVYLWDFPRIGTPEFPSDGDLEHEDVKECDFFVILSDNRLKQQDMWLAKMLEKQRKPFCFVRTKMDLECGATSAEGVRVFWESIVSDKFKSNVLLFLTSSLHPSSWDTLKLLNIFTEEIADLKKGGWLNEINMRPKDNLGGKQLRESSGSATAIRATLTAPGSNNNSKLASINPQQSAEEFTECAIAALELEKEVQDEVRSLMRGHDFADIPEELRKRLDACEEMKIDIGVVGPSGSGKSTFINTIRGLKPSDDQAARVGTTETTMNPTVYPHPTNGNVLFWDLPGVGTPNFPKDTYLDNIDFHKKDFFIIITSTRFTENDAWLAREVLSNKKLCYFVRTKVDEAVKNDFEDNNLTEEYVIKKLRDDCMKHLINLKGPISLESVPRIFIISGKQPDKFDFEKLKSALLEDLPFIKRQVLLCLILNTTQPGITHVANEIRKRVPRAAVFCALGAVIPIPGLSFGVTLTVMRSEIKSYRRSFGLHNAGLRKLCHEVGLLMQRIEAQLHKYWWHNLNDAGIKRLLRTLAPEHIGKEVVAAIPVVGATVGATMAYTEAQKVLFHIIEEMEKAALDLNSFVEAHKRTLTTK